MSTVYLGEAVRLRSCFPCWTVRLRREDLSGLLVNVTHVSLVTFLTAQSLLISLPTFGDLLNMNCWRNCVYRTGVTVQCFIVMLMLLLIIQLIKCKSFQYPNLSTRFCNCWDFLTFNCKKCYVYLIFPIMNYDINFCWHFLTNELWHLLIFPLWLNLKFPLTFPLKLIMHIPGI